MGFQWAGHEAGVMSDAWTADDVPDLSGETVVVTGANSGIGFEATRVLADAGAHVVLAVRSVERGQAAASEVREALPDASLSVGRCDLADLDSVARFADTVREKYDGLRALCNNAGVMAVPRSETAQGFETQFGVNHLGHFALTGHLLPLLAETPGESRVVTQSSGLHERGRVDFDDLHGRDGYDEWAAYAQSKLANVLFAREFDRRLADAGVEGMTSVAVHPGYADTNLQRRGPEQRGSTLRLYAMKVANAVFAQSAEAGALPMLYAATAADVDGGAYYGPGGFLNMRGTPARQAPSDRAQDPETAARLWADSEELTGVAYPFDAVGAGTPA
jgi:NAD(P)-dependent dehydrogenase (short-subunit alcohol dehydrogenase family)